MLDQYVRERLEYLRSQIEAECISMGEISELQELAEYIDPTDVVLLQWAGVPEHGWLVTYEIPITFTVVANTEKRALEFADEAMMGMRRDYFSKLEDEYNVEIDHFQFAGQVRPNA